MNKVIVLGSSHHNSLGLLRSLGEEGIKADFICRIKRRDWCPVAHSRYIGDVYFCDSDEGIIKILQTRQSNKKEKSIILCGDDQAIRLLDAHHDVLCENFYFFNANGKQGRINYYLDKINTFPLAARHGLTIIKTWPVKDGVISGDVVYPCLIKGANSTTSQKADMFVCKDEVELLAHLPKAGEYVVQEYVEKSYELNIIGLSYNHGRNVYLPAVVRKIRDEIGRQSVYIRLDDVKVYADLNVQGLKNFIGEIGYEGLFSIEVMYKDGKYYFLEVNLRNDGCCYLYTAAGINLPYLWVRYCLERASHAEVERGGCIPFEIGCIRFNAPFYMMSFWDLFNVFDGHVSFGRWIWQCLMSGGYFIWDWKDPMPFIISTLIHARQAGKKILRKLSCFNIR